MDNTKIGNKEAVALLVTITFTHIVLNITKSIIETTSSASLINILYLGIITIILQFAFFLYISTFFSVKVLKYKDLSSFHLFILFFNIFQK